MDAPVSDDDSATASLLLRRALVALALGLLGWLCLRVLGPFLSPILWAIILAYVTWPLYRRLRAHMRSFHRTAATAMSLLVAGTVVVPILVLLVLVQRELVGAYKDFAAYLTHGPHALPAAIRDLPWIGSWLQESLDRYSSDPTALGRELTGWAQHWGSQLAELLGDAGRNLVKLFVTILTLFFLYRDGDALVAQVQRVATRFFADRLDRSMHAAAAMTRAVVYGLLVTALAQGSIAAIGYRIVGLEAPILLGAITGLLSTAPLLGTAFVWVPLAVGLVVTGHTWQGVVLLAWGALLVHPVDNVLRPLLISNVTRVPFLLVMLGVLGGLAAFGLIGAFAGPVLLGIATSLWNDWAAPGTGRGA